VTTFVDTSALMAVMSAGDAAHAMAKPVWGRLLTSGESLMTTNYVALELHALVQRRFGMAGVNVLESVFMPALAVHWVNRETHETASTAVALSNRRDLSLVDCTSFTVMRECGVLRAFTLDSHFAEQGFEVLPGG
jgi:uncharacterized protein